MCGDRAVIIYATLSDRCNEHQHHPLTQNHSKLGFTFLLQCDHLCSCLIVKEHSNKWITISAVTLQNVQDPIFFRKAGRTACCFCDRKNIRLLFWESFDVAVHYSSCDIFSAVNLVTRQKNIYSKIPIVQKPLLFVKLFSYSWGHMLFKIMSSTTCHQLSASVGRLWLQLCDFKRTRHRTVCSQISSCSQRMLMLHHSKNSPSWKNFSFCDHRDDKLMDPFALCG